MDVCTLEEFDIIKYASEALTKHFYTGSVQGNDGDSDSSSGADEPSTEEGGGGGARAASGIISLEDVTDQIHCSQTVPAG